MDGQRFRNLAVITNDSINSVCDASIDSKTTQTFSLMQRDQPRKLELLLNSFQANLNKTLINSLDHIFENLREKMNQMEQKIQKQTDDKTPFPKDYQANPRLLYATIKYKLHLENLMKLKQKLNEEEKHLLLELTAAQSSLKKLKNKSVNYSKFINF